VFDLFREWEFKSLNRCGLNHYSNTREILTVPLGMYAMKSMQMFCRFVKMLRIFGQEFKIIAMPVVVSWCAVL
jgi:hypothetical protein